MYVLTVFNFFFFSFCLYANSIQFNSNQKRNEKKTLADFNWGSRKTEKKTRARVYTVAHRLAVFQRLKTLIKVGERAAALVQPPRPWLPTNQPLFSLIFTITIIIIIIKHVEVGNLWKILHT